MHLKDQYPFALDFDMLIRTYRWMFTGILLVFIVSCDDVDEVKIPPVINILADSGFISQNSEISPGGLMKFKLDLRQGTEPLTNFFIEVEDSYGSITRVFDTALYEDHFIWTGSFYKTPEVSENWSFHLHDRQGEAARASIEITAGSVSVYGQVVAIEDIILGAQNSSVNGFYSLNTFAAFDRAEAKEHQTLIDLLYYFGEDAHTIASPGANIEDGIYPTAYHPVNWNVRNTARFIETAFTTEDFNAITNDSLMITTYVDAEGKRKAKNLIVGEVYVFKIEDGRLGFFYVEEVIGTSEGQIQIDIKIQEAK